MGKGSCFRVTRVRIQGISDHRRGYRPMRRRGETCERRRMKTCRGSRRLPTARRIDLAGEGGRREQQSTKPLRLRRDSVPGQKLPAQDVPPVPSRPAPTLRPDPVPAPVRPPPSVPSSVTSTPPTSDQAVPQLAGPQVRIRSILALGELKRRTMRRPWKRGRDEGRPC